MIYKALEKYDTFIRSTHFESIRHEPDARATSRVHVSKNDDLVTLAYEALRELVYVAFHTPQVGVEKI